MTPSSISPSAGLRLTPRHYAYLKISEGCNNRCSFCIIPALRGDLVSRPAANVLAEAERLVRAGVKELLVISQDTSAYGLDLRYATSKFRGREVRAKFIDLCRELARFGVWVRLHYVYPYLHVDDVLPLMADGAILPYLDIPSTRSAAPPQGDAAPGQAGAAARADRCLAACLPRPCHPLDLHRRLSRRDRGGLQIPARLACGGADRAGRLLQIRAGGWGSRQ